MLGPSGAAEIGTESTKTDIGTEDTEKDSKNPAAKACPERSRRAAKEYSPQRKLWDSPEEKSKSPVGAKETTERTIQHALISKREEIMPEPTYEELKAKLSQLEKEV